MIRAVIIEDEQHLSNGLQKKLEKLGAHVVAQLDSVANAKAFFEQPQTNDLVFSDIQLGDGLSFEIFSEIDKPPFIIFTTAFDEYTLNAFKLNSIDYLLKPISEEKLKDSIDKFRHYQASFQPNLTQLMFQLENATLGKKHYLVKIGNFFHSIPTTEIRVVFSENKITYLYTDRPYPYEATLHDMENELSPHQFFRVSRQCIVNRSYITEIKVYQQSRLQLTIAPYPEPVIVSRERVADFKEWLAS